MEDSYMNLTLKVLHGLTWANRHCAHFNFLVKVDSDVFFNPFSLVDYFYSHNLLSDPDLDFLGEFKHVFPAAFLPPVRPTLYLPSHSRSLS